MLVFLLIVTSIQLSESYYMQSNNVTLFLFNHPSSCKNREFYSLDYFSCFPCAEGANLQSSLDRLSCECTRSSKLVAIYDSFLRHPICAKPCENRTNTTCTSLTTNDLATFPCKLKYINITSEKFDVGHQRIRINPDSQGYCSCDLKSNYLYDDYCIWKELFKNYVNHNAFSTRGHIYENLKFIAFFCQSLHNLTACNHMANLCVQAFFNTDKNSPCRLFLHAQASDSTLYSSMGNELFDQLPFLFYQRGKNTREELERKFFYSTIAKGVSQSIKLDLFASVYSLNGQLIRFGQLQPNHVNLCGYTFHGLNGFSNFLTSHRIKCELSMETIIDMAALDVNGQFFSVFLNFTRDKMQLMQAVPVLIEDAFDVNRKPNIDEWQLVKRFQLIGSHSKLLSRNSKAALFENSYKLTLFTSIRVLRKFELRCFISNDKISTPLLVLNYHQIEISQNTSLQEKYKFEFLVKFEIQASSTAFYKICLPFFLTIAAIWSVLRVYFFKCRRNLECYDLTTVLEFILHLLSNVGNSLLVVFAIEVFHSTAIMLTGPYVNLTTPLQNLKLFSVLIYSALILKSFHLAVYCWRIAHIDIFFIDWEKPKGYDISLQCKNLETSSHCSSTRTIESNISAWRFFFVSNEWITLSGKQRTSSFIQGLASLAVYQITVSAYPSVSSNLPIKLFASMIIFSTVYIIQIIFRNIVINQVLGSPLQKFLDICTMANMSIFTLLDSSFGYYIHGRSPHGFSDTDITSMILQLERESQNMCGKRGLLTDSEFQTYIILPPSNLRPQIEKLFKRKAENPSQTRFRKEFGSVGYNIKEILERGSVAYSRINNFFCAFIDHGIKDMDYIIKEKTFIENFLNCELEGCLAKGTFYIDSRMTFSSLFLYGNSNNIFVIEILILMCFHLLTGSYEASLIIVCIFNKLFQKVFRMGVRNNIASKTVIDKRFLLKGEPITLKQCPEMLKDIYLLYF